jgi:hypothetical protein
MSHTEDMMMLQKQKQKETDYKKDERIVEKVERVIDALDYSEDKEQIELSKLEKSKEYYLRELKTAEDYYEKEVRKQQDNLERKQQYFRGQLDALEKKEDILRQRFEKVKERKESKLSRLQNQVKTKKGLQLLNTEAMPQHLEVNKTERQLAIEYQEEQGNTRQSYQDCKTKFPTYFKDCEEEIKKKQDRFKQSPEVINAKIHAENEAIAAELEQKKYEDILGVLKRKQKKAQQDWKDAKARGAAEEEIQDLKNIYDDIMTDVTTKMYQFERVGKF